MWQKVIIFELITIQLCDLVLWSSVVIGSKMRKFWSTTFRIRTSYLNFALAEKIMGEDQDQD